jgi:hypothetical protein
MIYGGTYVAKSHAEILKCIIVVSARSAYKPLLHKCYVFN